MKGKEIRFQLRKQHEETRSAVDKQLMGWRNTIDQEITQLRGWINKTPERRLAEDIGERDKLVNASLDRVHARELELVTRLAKIEDQSLHERLLVVEGFKRPAPTIAQAEAQTMSAVTGEHQAATARDTAYGWEVTCGCGQKIARSNIVDLVNAFIIHRR